MPDALLLRGARAGNEGALARIIDKYTAYVCTVIRGITGERATREDVEELASDVFLALWENADNARSLKPYLAAIARNKAKNRLRAARDTLPLDDKEIPSDGAELDDAVILGEEQRAVRSAVLALDTPDREIFVRHYYKAQTVAAIAAGTGMTEAAVKHRLVRGREKLKRILDREVGT
jgi:RNA polymerase sigma-70 factor (ECF subfamily)